jgi:hypothetical protein
MSSETTPGSDTVELHHHAVAAGTSALLGSVSRDAPTSATPESAKPACQTTELNSTGSVVTLPPSTCAKIHTMQISTHARSVQPTHGQAVSAKR